MISFFILLVDIFISVVAGGRLMPYATTFAILFYVFVLLWTVIVAKIKSMYLSTSVNSHLFKLYTGSMTREVEIQEFGIKIGGKLVI